MQCTSRRGVERLINRWNVNLQLMNDTQLPQEIKSSHFFSAFNIKYWVNIAEMFLFVLLWFSSMMSVYLSLFSSSFSITKLQKLIHNCKCFCDEMRERKKNSPKWVQIKHSSASCNWVHSSLERSFFSAAALLFFNSILHVPLQCRLMTNVC